MGNLRSANKAFSIFNSQLSSSNPSLVSTQVSSGSSNVHVYPSLPLLNFISLLLLAIQHGTADLFRELTNHYALYIQEVGIWDDALTRIAEIYFNIRVPRQSNPLFDMMNNMLFGGGPGGGNPRPGSQMRGSSKKVEAPPSSMELD
jgi:golgi to ER traffic protein 4